MIINNICKWGTVLSIPQTPCEVIYISAESKLYKNEFSPVTHLDDAEVSNGDSCFIVAWSSFITLVSSFYVSHNTYYATSVNTYTVYTTHLVDTRRFTFMFQIRSYSYQWYLEFLLAPELLLYRRVVNPKASRQYCRNDLAIPGRFLVPRILNRRADYPNASR